MTRYLTIVFSGILGENPAGDPIETGQVIIRGSVTAAVPSIFLYARRTDSTNPTDPLYTSDRILEQREFYRLVPDNTGTVEIALIPSEKYLTPMEYVLRIDENEIAFQMPDHDTTLNQILGGGGSPQPGDGATYYLLWGTESDKEGVLLSTDFTMPTNAAHVTTAQSRTGDAVLVVPDFDDDGILFYAQPASEDDIQHINVLQSSGGLNQDIISYWEKRAITIEINGVTYEVWQTIDIVYPSTSGRRYQFVH